ncbi:cupin domain-containing protein [Natrinema versiforme]|uniref:Cupin domain-containing protein n=1 Tax=Natrinema versiforme TaxID=88724 RepID=A0A4P8WHZ8_9EURY|nr:cupin domain-containing protein [Natrinema versiforme]QCS42662.1 cupin domain-containing protein [Natrinema versiforme]
MEKVAIDDVDTELNPMGVHSVRRPISDTLGFSDFAMNYFELEPGESFSGGMHTHHDQEEVFYVQEGTATFETRTSQRDADDASEEKSEVTVDEGEVIRFEPGDFQHGYNDTDERVVGFAFGAPESKHDWDQIESLVYCRDCEAETAHGLELTDEGNFRMTCTECGHAFVPQ